MTGSAAEGSREVGRWFGGCSQRAGRAAPPIAGLGGGRVCPPHVLCIRSHRLPRAALWSWVSLGRWRALGRGLGSPALGLAGGAVG